MHPISTKKLECLRSDPVHKPLIQIYTLSELLCSSESTNFKQQSFLRNGSSAGQEIPHILMTPAGSAPYSPEPATCPNPKPE